MAKVSHIFECVENIFKVSLTEKYAKSHLRKKGFYKEPVKFTLDEGVADTLQHRPNFE